LVGSFQQGKKLGEQGRYLFAQTAQRDTYLLARANQTQKLHDILNNEEAEDM